MFNQKSFFMIRRIVLLVSIVGFLASCDFGMKKQAALQKEVDSLKTELIINQQVANTLEEVGILLDSIDRNRNILRTDMIEGTSYDQYLSRMAELNDYVKDTEAKIRSLEESAKSSKSASRSYAASIKKLKAELETRNNELAVLQEQVERYRNENENLIQTVALQKAEIEDKITKLDSSVNQIGQLNGQIETLLTQSKIDQGEAYYLRALALETAADRTKFAPRKKKETRTEALELYKLAASFGKEEAQSRIVELESKI